MGNIESSYPIKITHESIHNIPVTTQVYRKLNHKKVVYIFNPFFNGWFF